MEVIKAKIVEIQRKLDELKKLIESMEKQKCFLCQGTDHTSKDCIDIHVETDDDRDFHEVYHENTDSEDDDEYYQRIFCYRCGRIGHYSVQCYASTHINGDDLDDYTDGYHSE